MEITTRPRQSGKTADLQQRLTEALLTASLECAIVLNPAHQDWLSRTTVPDHISVVYNSLCPEGYIYVFNDSEWGWSGLYVGLVN